MNKNKFLEDLRLALTGEVPEREIISQIDYYNSYITSESINRSEQEVLEELGSPYLIARTIIDAYERAYGQTYRNFSDRNNKEQWDASDYSSSPNYNQEHKDRSQSTRNRYYKVGSSNIPWYIKALIILFLLFIFILLILFGSLLVGILIKLIPIIFIVSIIVFIVQSYKKS